MFPKVVVVGLPLLFVVVLIVVELRWKLLLPPFGKSLLALLPLPLTPSLSSFSKEDVVVCPSLVVVLTVVVLPLLVVVLTVYEDLCGLPLFDEEEVVVLYAVGPR